MKIFTQPSRGGVVVLNYENSDVHRTVENCYRTSKTLINPMLNWDDEYLWWYIKQNDICVNPLYSKGHCRVGCIGCPMAGQHRWTEFREYPVYKDNYIKAFDRMIVRRRERGLKTLWETGLKCFKWWMEDENIDGQLSFDMDGNITEDYT